MNRFFSIICLIITLILFWGTFTNTSAQSYFQDERGEYLIIVNDMFYQEILQLANWKHQKGLDVEIARISQIGSTPTQIKNYILNAYQNWDVPPYYVLLVGDTEFVQTDNYTDNFYADMEGDFHAELVVGRLSCDDMQDCELMVAKNMGYEFPVSQPNPDWMKSAALIVRDDYDGSDVTYYADTFYAYDLMIEAGFTTIDTFFAKHGADAADVENSVTQGRTFVNYRGQGTGNWWNPFSVDPENMDNGLMLPVVISATCGTGNFFDDSHVCEEWVRAGTPSEPKGSIAFFGAKTVGSGVHLVRSKVDRGFFKAVFEDDVKILGEACLSAKEYLIDQLPGEVSEYKGWNLLGDPELYIWTDHPDTFYANHLPFAPLGAFDYNVDVYDSDGNPISDARVCATKGEEIHEIAFTDETGSVTLPINAVTTGNMTLVISQDGYYPYVQDIPIVTTLSAIEGYVKNGETDVLLQNAKVFIEETGQYTFSDANGFYRLYIAESGSYDVQAELFGFYAYMEENIQVAESDTVNHDVMMDPKPSTSLEGYILDEKSGLPVANAEIKPINATVNPTYSGSSGYYIFPDIPADYDYEMEVTHESYASKVKWITVPSGENVVMDVELAYIQKFEENNADFDGEEEWEWGIATEVGGPASAFSGDKVWGTDLNYFYDPNQNQSLFTAEYYLAPNNDYYKLTFYHWYEILDGWDGGNVQISTDDSTWTVLEPVGRYPDQSVVALTGQPGYTGEQLEWTLAEFDLTDYIGETVTFRFRFASTNCDDKRGWFIDNFAVHGAGSEESAVDDKEIAVATPKQIRLDQNYPNPFNPETTIRFNLPEKTNIDLSIYDTSGKLVRTLINGETDAGYHAIPWNGSDERNQPVPSGIYVYRLETQNEIQTKRCILLK